MNKNFALLFAGLFAFGSTVFANEETDADVVPAVQEEVVVEKDSCAKTFAKKAFATVWTNRSKLEIAGAAYVLAALVCGYKDQTFGIFASNDNSCQVVNAGRRALAYTTSPFAAARNGAAWVVNKIKPAGKQFLTIILKREVG